MSKKVTNCFPGLSWIDFWLRVRNLRNDIRLLKFYEGTVIIPPCEENKNRLDNDLD